MNKQELLEEIVKLDIEVSENFPHYDLVDKEVVLALIDQLDEPEKPVIPQFVADWIEEKRVNISDWRTENPERFFLILGHRLHYATLASTNIGVWVFGGNEEKLYQALKYGYEVEKEKLYQVELPTEGLHHILTMHGDGKGHFFGKEHTNNFWYRTHLTEQEIKVIDERFWAFAEEVIE